MCGICGIARLHDGPPPSPEVLHRMVGTLRHRGPDENGGYQDAEVALGHTRLSIIDLASGKQPMTNETGEIWVVFNGEIFNYLELATELESLGHRFKTRSDTETIVHAYEQWGPACVERFNGQFAFAVWDSPKRELFLTRDRVGIRPLYYAQAGGQFLFASEMKAIVQHPAVHPRLDPRGLSQIFTFWAPVAPQTALEGIQQLPPGTSLLLKDNTIKLSRYWQPSFLRDDRPHSYLTRTQVADLAVEFRERLEEATKLRMLRADVPVGAYMSGGIDSSVIGALVRRFHHGHLRTFSLRFSHPDFDEGHYQRDMIERLGTEHFEVRVDYADIAEAFSDVVWYAEAPMLRAAPVPLYLLSRLVRQNGYKVVLTGEGSDEFLAGYDIFREDRVRRFWARDTSSRYRPLLLSRLYPWLQRSPIQARALQRTFFGKGMDQLDQPWFSHVPRWDSARGLQRLFSKDLRSELTEYEPLAQIGSALPEGVTGFEPLGRAQSVEIATLLSGYLLSTQGDRMLMGNSVEGRFPFLDHHVMEFANALPPEAKLRVLDEKHVLKQAARDLIPSSILQRPKQPYRAPDAQSFVQDPPPAFVEQVTSPAAVETAGIFDPTGVARLMAKARRNRDRTPSNADNMAVVGVLSTQLMHRFFVEGAHPPTSAPPKLDRWVDRTSQRK